MDVFTMAQVKRAHERRGRSGRGGHRREKDL